MPKVPDCTVKSVEIELARRETGKWPGLSTYSIPDTPESKDRISLKDAHKLRDRAVHGLGERESLMVDCSRFRRFLIHKLNASILTTLTSPGYSQCQSIKSLMAGDYEFRPCSRSSIRFNEGLMSPYLGEWVEGNVDRESRRGASGQGRLDLSMSIEQTWAIDASHRDFVESVSYEEFRRMGQEAIPLPDGKMPSLIPWQDRPSSPAWKPASDMNWES